MKSPPTYRVPSWSITIPCLTRHAISRDGVGKEVAALDVGDQRQVRHFGFDHLRASASATLCVHRGVDANRTVAATAPGCVVADRNLVHERRGRPRRHVAEKSVLAPHKAERLGLTFVDGVIERLANEN